MTELEQGGGISKGSVEDAFADLGL